ncbi:hypothetical protein KUL156_10850 [Alteromonas sp. KUL156]|nr:hypothetical protein KUL154_43010 [Alteromonas sp. KUL154]GFD98492.1 hypothetical protein KUL156_10850 [Alteromonas sp. KUL156]
MKYNKLSKFIALIGFFIATFVNAQEVETNYEISTDDTLQVTVFNEPDLSLGEVRIGTNGTISMPLLGQVEVSGLTVQEIEAKLTLLLLDGYLKKPKVSVGILEYRPFYINGEVENPGSYAYRRGLTVEKAITLAGGFTNRADRKQIELVAEKNKDITKVVGLKASIQPGDVITVNESFF